ncbi:Ephrin_rec_like domain-containing protein [Durusdinium trenchii]|uniref:Ephrin_rec_like domain-containing protein n=1 Tax=Durusdinium trenchii TaxID=1381693 RepID=A0ABP0SNS2_9DINO
MAICVNCVFLLVVISWAMWVAPRRFHLKSFRMRWKFMIQKMRLLFYTTISYVFLPWRSVFVTILDIGTHVSTLLLCLLLPFLIDFDQEEQQTAVCLRSNKNRGAYVAIPIFSLKVLGVAVINGHFWSSFHSAFILLSCG